MLNSSFYDLVSSIQLCTSLNRGAGSCVYSKFNLKLISFLTDRGVFLNFSITKGGPSGKINFFLRKVNGSFPFSTLFSPAIGSSNYTSKFSKYKTFRSLTKCFSSEFVVVSTTKGLMTANEAISSKLGGLVVIVFR
jgi:ribosomal protein S8